MTVTTERADASVIVALFVGLAALLPAGWLIAQQSDPDLAVQVVTIPVAETVTEVVVEEPIVIAGLDPAVSAVLQAGGFLGRTDVNDALDPAIAAVLADHGVVLRVAEAANPEAAGR